MHLTTLNNYVPNSHKPKYVSYYLLSSLQWLCQDLLHPIPNFTEVRCNQHTCIRRICTITVELHRILWQWILQFNDVNSVKNFLIWKLFIVHSMIINLPNFLVLFLVLLHLFWPEPHTAFKTLSALEIYKMSLKFFIWILISFLNNSWYLYAFLTAAEQGTFVKSKWVSLRSHSCVIIANLKSISFYTA